VLLHTDSDELTISATDLALSITTTFTAAARITEPGALTLPFKLFNEFVRALPPDEVIAISTPTPNNAQARIQCAGHKAAITGIAAEEFPLFPDIPPTSTTIPAAGLLDAIKQVSFAAAREDSRPTLSGICTVLDDGKLTLATADGFRMAVCSQSIDSAAEISAIIPVRAMSELVRLMPDTTINISIDNNRVVFRAAGVMVACQLIEGTFPDYRQIIPENIATTAVVDRRELIARLKVARMFALSSDNIIEWHLDGDLTITAKSAHGGETSDMAAAITGPGLELAFNVNYLLDALKVIDAEQVRFGFNQPTTPVLITPVNDDDLEIVVMPMNMRR
jgi:DNA polymerase-3 subunit beta